MILTNANDKSQFFANGCSKNKGLTRTIAIQHCL